MIRSGSRASRQAVDPFRRGVSLEQVPQTGAVREAPDFAEHPVEHHPLFHRSEAAAEVERGARREGDEVERPVLQVVDHLREKRDPRRQGDRRLRRHVKPLDVLVCDVEVRADVEDVDPRDARGPQVLDRLRDDPLGEHRLAEAHLVGQEEPAGRIGVGVHPPEDVVHRGPLEVLQAGHDLRDV